MILSAHVAIRQRIMHDTSLNRTCGFLVCKLNVALALSSMMEVSPDEGRADSRLASNDATLQSKADKW